MLKTVNTEDSKMNKMFDLTSTKIIDEEKKFPFSSFNNIDKKLTEDDLDLPIGLRNKQGFRKIDDTLRSKPVFI